ncbi:MAG: flavin reductase family protein [Longimicrobiales bacterium]|nr:flavin reductase family protein [Longimicrobiales bacterium]
MAIEEAEFRRVLGHFATGIAVVAARDGAGPPRGLTANAIASVSLDPPLVLVCVEHGADTHDVIDAAGAFAISLLDEDGEALARRFASYDPSEKFDGVAYTEEATGAPILNDALAWVDCRVWARYDGGDHTIFVGEVVGADAEDGPPLVYFRGGYGRLAP